MASQPISTIDDRTEPRHDVFHRTRVTLANQRVVSAIVVNLSPHGLMVRIDAEIGAGERVTIGLPVIGPVGATVRWALGGRIGCQLERPIDPAIYRAVLAAAGGDQPDRNSVTPVSRSNR